MLRLKLGLGLSPSKGGGFSVYVANEGDNGAAGTRAAPLATMTQALTNTTSGQSIGIKSGQSHVSPNLGVTGFKDRTVGIYDGTEKAVLDVRQSLAGATWTLTSGIVWQTTVTFTETPSALNGAVANSTHFQVWDEAGGLMTWRVGGADIAANIAAVQSNPGSFTVHRSGSTAQDPRSDTAGANYVFYVSMDDEGDPNGRAVKVADRQYGAVFSGGTLKNLTLIGGYSKDANSLGTNGSTPPTLENVLIDAVPAHAFVGPCNGRGLVRAVGRTVPGSANAAFGYNLGGLFNLFTQSYVDAALAWADIEAVGAGIAAVYGHGGGTNKGYPSLYIRSLSADTGTAILQFDKPTSGGNANTPFVDAITIDAVNATNMARGFIPTGDLTVNSGTIVFATNANMPTITSQSLVTLDASGTRTVLLKDLDVTFGYDSGNAFSGDNFLVQHAGVSTPATATITFDGVRDLTSSPTAKGGFGRSSTYNGHIVITGGSQLADLQRFPSGTNMLPSSLTVDAGCTFGLGDRSGPQIEALLDGLGVTHSISHDTTIINRAGTVKSSPGW